VKRLKLLVRQSESKGQVVIHKHRREDNTKIDLRAKKGCGMELFVSGRGEELCFYRKFAKTKGTIKIEFV